MLLPEPNASIIVRNGSTKSSPKAFPPTNSGLLRGRGSHLLFMMELRRLLRPFDNRQYQAAVLYLLTVRYHLDESRLQQTNPVPWRRRGGGKTGPPHSAPFFPSHHPIPSHSIPSPNRASSFLARPGMIPFHDAQASSHQLDQAFRGLVALWRSTNRCPSSHRS